MPRFFKANPARVLLLVGSIMIIQSIAWEYARMKPDYRFIVDPWSIRGYTTPQGRAIAILGVGILLMSYIVWKELWRDSRWQGLAVAGVAWVSGIVIAAVAAPESFDFTLNDVGGIFLALILSFVAVRVAADLGRDRISLLRNRLVMFGGWLVTFLIVLVAIVRPLLVDEAVSMRLAVVVAVLLAMPMLLAVTARPHELAVNRVLINSVVATWIVVTTSAGALRSTVLRLQFEDAGVSAQYKDVQITSGLILAWIGAGLTFVGAVALWARRRDHLAAQQRAAQQRAAARESVAELADSTTETLV